MLLRDLAWITALADLGHLTDTAATLGVAQPTLSRALARVEAELGTRLFERLPTGVVPNPHGALVVTAARELTARYEQLRTELAGRLDPDTGVVRLAFLDSMATSLVPALLRAFHAHAPRLRVVLRQEPGHVILDDLRSGAAEFAITSPRPPGGHGWIPLQDERLLLVVPPVHPLRDRDRVALAELAAEEFITTPQGFGFRALLEGLFAEAGIAPAISFESADLATIEGLVAAGLGVALLPEPFAGLSGTVGIPLTTAAARRTVGLTWRTGGDLTPAAARFLDFVRTLPPHELSR
ncbi:LysR family transcriptional regulator [Actinokineospora bangkokensis]|uniref:LysR family transcriptional regulator n=1 Tax=Actinokineospora bangkokensis TaxID=1193682 RepID=A0A1Q9LPA4_9PSEU|nr:LysR family transcriptional regulator [Actinokineospora bangkokensis]OLR93887.1 LysR family transcriptional regulator [Actinokineospora bangkokensis]